MTEAGTTKRKLRDMLRATNGYSSILIAANKFDINVFFFFYLLFKVDIQNYVIVISLVTIY